MGHSFSHLLVHIIFSTKGRINSIYTDLQNELFPYICGISKGENSPIYQINGVEDHIHILVALHPATSVSDYIKRIKTHSTKWIHSKFPNSKNFAWQSGYASFSVSESSKRAVANYIATQKEHHKRINYAEEIKSFLEKHRVDFDSKHYLD